jgi:hypothetical protein
MKVSSSSVCGPANIGSLSESEGPTLVAKNQTLRRIETTISAVERGTTTVVLIVMMPRHRVEMPKLVELESSNLKDDPSESWAKALLLATE